MNHNQELGKFGEDLACQYLIRHGYQIRHRNFKASYKELDIVAVKDKELVFAEVKTRLSWMYGDGTESMSQKKQRDLKYAINKYRTIFHKWEEEARGDLIIVHLDKEKGTAKIQHFQDIL